MTTTTHQMTSRTEIENLVDRFHHSLDERVLDEAWARDFLTDDVRFVMPVGTDNGRADVLAQTRRSVLQFARTVHFGTNLLVGVDGDSATVRWNALCTHVPPEPREADLFVSAGVFSGRVVRDVTTWRFAELTFDVTWTQGRPPGA